SRSAEGQALVPTTVTAAAVCGGIQAQETFKLLHGTGAPGGTAFLYHGQALRAMRVRLARRPDCLAHTPIDVPIVGLEADSRSLTLGGLLREARRHLGDRPRIHLDRQLLLRYVCPEC